MAFNQFMRRFLRSSTKPAASRNRPLRAVPTTASQFAPVWGRTAAGEQRLSALHSAPCSVRLPVRRSVSGGVCGRSVSRCSAVLCRGIRGHRGRGGAVRLFGGVRLVGRIRGIVARHVRFTGFRGQFGQHHMLGLAALVNAADVVCIAFLFQRRLHDLAHQLPVVQVLVLQLGGVNNCFGVLLHVLAVVDGLVKGAEVVTGQIPPIVADRTMSRSSRRTVVIHPDNDAAVFAEGRFSVFVIADDIGSTLTGTDGAFLIQPAGRIDGGVARGAVDGNGDILHFVGVEGAGAAADGRCKTF